jgi:hypothetical protein
VSAAEAPTLTILSANLLAGGIGRSRTGKRFEALLDRLADLQPDVAAFQFSDLPGECSGCSGGA